MREENNQNNPKKEKGRRKKSLVKKYKGLGKKVWKRLGGTNSYLRSERNMWQKEE